MTQFLNYLKDKGPKTGKRVPRRSSTRVCAQNIVLGPTMAEIAGGGVVRSRDVSRGGGCISRRGRGRGQVSRRGLICAPYYKRQNEHDNLMINECTICEQQV